MIAMALITTIIPTFRRPHLLKRAIASVLRQTCPDFRVCVYDNASGDGTADVVAEFAKHDARVSYHRHAENIGAGPNFNFGLARVTTPYFSFLSDDDILLPGFYETALAGFTAFPDAGMSAASTVVMSETGKILTVPLELWPREGCFGVPEGLFQLIEAKLPVWTTILFRKAVTDEVGLLQLGVGGGSDFDFQLKVACRSPLVVSRQACGIFVSHEHSTTGTSKVGAFWPGLLRLVENVSSHSHLTSEEQRRARSGLMRYIEATLFSIGWKLISARDFAGARLAADVLGNELSARRKGRLLAAAAALCGSVDVAARCVDGAYRLARSLRQATDPNRRRWQRQYGHLARYLSA